MSFLLRDQNYDPEEEIRRRQSAVKITKQKLLQAIVESYNLDHRINTKTGEIQKKKSLTALQMKQHKQIIQVARHQRTQKEKSICSSIEKVKRLDQEIRQLQHKSVL
ncbi:unnamed protein product [Mucor circinelloides]|uniref:Uncharacterized protein n=1 Tax=Mucor circinelloides f. circinelloides (strain 1006PhL) TaxID=1220926 RepID=S2IZV1_MUCC1|nr:hypothetical protein HMPREF1544_11891 [Mucor circinelloides 1006PhL]KAG1081609.1 hypothetical protein G6F42_022889 [Rhizopus arrhizus]